MESIGSVGELIDKKILVPGIKIVGEGVEDVNSYDNYVPICTGIGEDILVDSKSTVYKYGEIYLITPKDGLEDAIRQADSGNYFVFCDDPTCFFKS